ncbi:MAG: amidohydrolase family protein, partial [Chloroflexota bacterium]|nr:amidohydrolase family protein [Chloroflexota bacterium]
MGPPLLAIVGPTASGKTDLALALARQLPLEILVADSRQVYRGMDVGTAKPDAAARAAVPHHLLDLVEADQPFTVADWVARARLLLPEIAVRGRLPLVVVGTGLYLAALVDGHDYERQAFSPETRQRLAAELEAEGLAALAERLARLDAAGAERIDLPGTTLMPGLIEGHSHLFLHPYDEALWDDQVLKEPLALRMARAVAAAAATLRAGITTERDLGTEGAFDSDVQLRRAIDQGIVPGPRLLVVTRAIVATGSYGPRRAGYSFDPAQGAEEATGGDEIARVTRSQIGHGADWVKVYADYSWGPHGEARPTFTLEELKALVEAARGSGRPVAAHAMTPEGMRRAVLAGVETVEHGDEGTPEVFRLMRQRGVT